MLASHCFSGDRILWASAKTGAASATLPLVDQGDRLAGLSNYYSFSYGPMFDNADDTGQRIALVARIAAELRQSRHRISLFPLIDDGDDMPELMRRAFAKAGWIALLTDQNGNHVLDVAGRSFSAYWAQRPGALRSSVKRKARAERYWFETVRHVDERIWREYLAVYGSSWKNAEPYPAMIRAIAEDAAGRDCLRLGFARTQEGIPAAAQLWTMEGDTACIHKIAHDSAEDAHSPGTLLSHHMFEHMIDREQVARIDYGTGGNSYKRDWMERERPMMRLDCFDPRKAALWLPALKTRISQLVRRPY